MKDYRSIYIYIYISFIWRIKGGLTRRNWNGMEWKWNGPKEKWRVRSRENTRGIRKERKGNGTLNGVPMGSRPRSARGSFITSHFPSLTSILLTHYENPRFFSNFDSIFASSRNDYLFTSLLCSRDIKTGKKRALERDFEPNVPSISVLIRIFSRRRTR